MPGILYLVGTPIGNLQDITPRAAAVLGTVDFIAAEDTRVTRKLLSYLHLHKPLVSYHEHALERGAALLDRVEAGETCAVCTDAGMPCISDPGEDLVRQALERGIHVVPIPGPSAFVTALAASGQNTGRFVFEGFLPTAKKERSARLAALTAEERTIVLYEAPHRLQTTLRDLAQVFGEQRGVTLCRELTKVHEQIIKTTLGEACDLYLREEPRGEFVLVVAGATPQSGDAAPPFLQVVKTARALHTNGLSAPEAARRAAADTPYSKSDIYRALVHSE